MDDTVTKRLAKQAEEIYHHRRKASRWDTHFYKVVLGGNVDEVKYAVDYMTENGMAECLNWLLKKRNNTGYNIQMLLLCISKTGSDKDMHVSVFISHHFSDFSCVLHDAHP